MPAVEGRTIGGASQYPGTFGIVVSGGGATLEYSRTRRPAASAIDSVSISASNLLADIHGTAEYRANLIKVMAQRAVTAAG